VIPKLIQLRLDGADNFVTTCPDSFEVFLGSQYLTNIAY
jgi:hypothetical protein